MRARTPSAPRTPQAKRDDRPKNVEGASGREPGSIRGRLVAHQDGYGFVVPESPIPGVAGDLFIRRDAMGDAMHGDTVLARVARREADGRADGRIVRVVRRANPSVVGLFRYGPRENVVLPYEPRIPEVVIPPGEELPQELANKLQLSRPTKPRERLPQLDGAVVNVEVLRYPAGGLVASGRVTEILGRPGEMGVDIEIIIRKHHIPHEFPPTCWPKRKGSRTLQMRRPLRAGATSAICRS